jgi:Flp pilus assembly pilin Flp
MKNYSEQQIEDGMQLGAIAVMIVCGVSVVVMAIASYYGIPL